MASEISKNKRKQIRRLAADSRPASEIAKAVNLPVNVVEEALREDGAESTTSGGTGAVGLGDILSGVALLGFAIAPLIQSKMLYNLSNLPQQIFVQVLSVLLLAGWAAMTFSGRDRRLFAGPGTPLVLAFLVWSGLSVLWAHNPYEHLFTYGHWLACGVIWFTVCQSFREVAWQQGLLYTIFGIGLVQAALGCVQYFLQVPPAPTSAFYGFFLAMQNMMGAIPQVAPPSGTFANKNFAVHVVVPALALGMAFFLRAKQRREVWFFAATSMIMATYLWYTGTRAGWLALGVQLVIWAVLLVRNRQHLASLWSKDKSIALPSVLVLLIIFCHLTPYGFMWTLKPQLDRLRNELKRLPALFAEKPPETVNPEDLLPSSGTTSSEVVDAQPWSYANQPALDIPPRPTISKEASFAGRLKVWTNSMYMVKDYPLRGVGLGNFRIHFPLYDGRHDGQPMFDDRIQLESSHNDYVQIWTELGTIGMLLAVAIVGSMLWFLVRIIRTMEEVRWEACGVLVGLFGMGANAFFSSPLQKAIPPLLVALFGAWVVLTVSRQSEGRVFNLPKLAYGALTVVAVIGFFMLWGLQVKRLKTDHHYVYMTAASKQAKWDICEQHSKIGAELLPSRSKIFSFLGKSYLEKGSLLDARASQDPSLTPEQRAAMKEEAREKYRMAIAEFGKAAAAYPNGPNTLFDIGVTHAKLGEADAAMEYYQRVKALVPTYPRLYNNIGAILIGQDQKEEALVAFRTEVALNPESDAVMLNLGLVFLQTGYDENSERALRLALNLKHDDPKRHALIWKNLGILLMNRLDRRAEGIEALRKSVEIDPEIAGAAEIMKLK